MKATFYHPIIGNFTLENIINIQPSGKNLWSVCYDDYSTEEVEGKLVEAGTESF